MIKLHEYAKTIFDGMKVHDRERCGSPDIYFYQSQVRKQLEIKSRHAYKSPPLRNEFQQRDSLQQIRQTLPDLSVPVRSDPRRQNYNQAISAVPYQFQTHHQRYPTPPISNASDHSDVNTEESQIIEEIIIDLDDELEEYENPDGGDSPSYAPNENIRVSEEDAVIFFNKKPKKSIIKSEVQKARCMKIVQEVRQLKEKADELRKLQLEKTSTARNLIDKSPDFENDQRSKRVSSTPMRDDNEISFNSVVSQIPNHENSPPSMLDQMIITSRISAQKQKEKDMQKRRQANQHYLSQANSFTYGNQDKYIERGSSSTLIASSSCTIQNQAGRKNIDTEPLIRNIGYEDIRSFSPRNRSKSPVYRATTPPTIEELDNMRSKSNKKRKCDKSSKIETINLDSDDEVEILD